MTSSREFLPVEDRRRAAEQMSEPTLQLANASTYDRSNDNDPANTMRACRSAFSALLSSREPRAEDQRASGNPAVSVNSPIYLSWVFFVTDGELDLEWLPP